jgi:uncharacterized protein YggE
MKKWLLIAGLCSVLILSGQVFAADVRHPTISVTGEGSVMAEPDKVDVYCIIKAEKISTQQAAMSLQATRALTVINYLQSMGVPAKDISTLSYSLGPQYEYINRQNVMVGYRAEQRLKVRTGKENIGAVVDGIAEHAQVYSVRFVVSNLRELQEEAIQKAIVDAQAKARRRAAQLGIAIGKICGYTEHGTGAQPRAYSRSADESGSLSAKAMPVLPSGEKKLTVRVTITYTFRALMPEPPRVR